MIGVAIFLALLQLASCLTLPEDWERCHRSDPQINSCLKDAIFKSFEKIGTNGVPSLGAKPIEPLDVDEINVQQKAKGAPVSLKITFKNAKVRGLSKSSVNKVDAHIDQFILGVDTETPALYIDADYVMDGQILVLPVKGKGKCNITLVDLVAKHSLHGKLNERDGNKYMDIVEYTLRLTTDRLYGQFDNLFNGDKVLGATMNKVINENSRLIFNEIKPSLEKSLSNVIREYAGTIFSKVPFDDIFLP